MELTGKDASRLLRKIAALMEVRGDDGYRIRAFSNAARAVERMAGDVGSLARRGELLSVRGVGRGTASVLAEAARGETPEVVEALHSAIPEGVRRFLDIRGLGPKKVRSLWRDLEIASLGELEYACCENRLVDLKGFGSKTQEAVLEGVRFQQRSRGQALIHEAWEATEDLRRRLADLTGETAQTLSPEDFLVAGELRRGSESVSQLGLVAAHEEPEGLGDHLALALEAKRNRDGSLEGRTEGETAWRLKICRAGELAYVLLAETGPEQHARALCAPVDGVGRSLARLPQGTDPTVGAVQAEREIYASAGYDWVPPELRDDPCCLEMAAAGTLPLLVEAEDFRGALHNHTTDSDGTASLEEMATAAANLGWRWVGIADHSPVAAYANGVNAERLRAQWDRIDAFNAAGNGPTIFKGLEADILTDGRLDIPQGCESGLDYVVASVHSAFRLSREDQTRRILAAVEHPSCRVLGHATGRLLLARPGYDVDLAAVIESCARHGVAVEINASPYRLDVDREWAGRALRAGARLIVNPDAHTPAGLRDVRWGLTVARRAGAGRDDLLNSLDTAGLARWLRRES